MSNKKKIYMVGLTMAAVITAYGVWWKKGQEIKEKIITHLPRLIQEWKKQAPALNMVLNSGHLDKEDIRLSGFPFQWRFHIKNAKMIHFFEKDKVELYLPLSYLFKRDRSFHLGYQWTTERFYPREILFQGKKEQDQNNSPTPPALFLKGNLNVKLLLESRKIQSFDLNLKELGADSPLLFVQYPSEKSPVKFEINMVNGQFLVPPAFLPALKDEKTNRLKLNGSLSFFGGDLPGIKLSLFEGKFDTQNQSLTSTLDYGFNPKTQEFKLHIVVPESRARDPLGIQVYRSMFIAKEGAFHCLIHIQNQDVMLNHQPVRDFAIRRGILGLFDWTKKFFQQTKGFLPVGSVENIL